MTSAKPYNLTSAADDDFFVYTPPPAGPQATEEEFASAAASALPFSCGREPHRRSCRGTVDRGRRGATEGQHGGQAMSAAEVCRCGHAGHDAEPHPCHFNGYTCRAPGSARFIAVPGASLAGVQMKVSAYQTFACDACWEKYKAMQAGAR